MNTFVTICPGDKIACANPDYCGKAGWCKSPEDAIKHRLAITAASSPTPAPTVAADPNPIVAQPVSAPVQPQTQTADATPGSGQGELIPPEDQTPEERAEVARMAANVELAFPPVGFIDPTAELEKMFRITQKMGEAEKLAYPERVRAAILAHEAGKGPEPSDEELALAIFIKRTTDTPLTQEELEAKTTGKKTRKADGGPKTPRGKKAQSSAEQLKNLLGL